jgi:hypothetical protein
VTPRHSRIAGVIRRRFLPVLLALALALAASCKGNESPTDPAAAGPHGTLTGLVTIGPNCTNEQPSNPCPTPPTAYLARKIAVFDSPKTRQLHTVDIDTQGRYFIRLAPASYVVELQTTSALDRTSDLPRTVTIRANVITTVDVKVDTGIR